MIAIGIDPGKQGGIAIISDVSKVIRLIPTPLIKAGKKGRDEYDLRQICSVLQSAGPNAFATVEKSQPLPPRLGGSIANFARGYGRGWEWMLTALQIPYQLVAPRAWMKVMHAGTPEGDTKVRSIIAAERLFPDSDLRRTPRCKGPADGLAESLLLAEYGRRNSELDLTVERFIRRCPRHHVQLLDAEGDGLNCPKGDRAETDGLRCHKRVCFEVWDTEKALLVAVTYGETTFWSEAFALRMSTIQALLRPGLAGAEA